ncbi:4'-phosphopantetheinyl transferase superfamily protein [Bdellovibrio sp. HCB2-146]|uniref:4'-phosphopantetheinyl transferase superfamily protein n=1 Tax=Bdellovibrio sp. HCB2-146 TaxID=3394362 RepID=UPI0039BC2B92
MTPAQIETFKKILSAPDLQIFTRPEWGAQNESHRELIRSFVSVLKISPDTKLSISHTQGMGLVAINSSSVGVDIEVSRRVTPATVARISREEEVKAAPSPAALWCAKEAAFKALRDFTQPPVVSKITIGDWQKIDSQLETFKIFNFAELSAPQNGLGLLASFSPYTYAFFVFPS